MFADLLPCDYKTNIFIPVNCHDTHTDYSMYSTLAVVTAITTCCSGFKFGLFMPLPPLEQFWRHSLFGLFVRDAVRPRSYTKSLFTNTVSYIATAT